MSASNRAAFFALLLLLWLQYVGTAPLFAYVEKTPPNAVPGTILFLGAWAFALWASLRPGARATDTEDARGGPWRWIAGALGLAGAVTWCPRSSAAVRRLFCD